MGVLNTTKKSTGGGVGGGYDRYLGTLGSAADAPKDSLFPNFTTFPTANKGEWVKITTSQTLGGKSLRKTEEWMCNTLNTPAGVSANWEIKSSIIPFSTFGTVQTIQRLLYVVNPEKTYLPRVGYYVPFNIAGDISRGKRRVAFDQTFTEISDIISYSQSLYYQFSASVEITPESSGTQTVGIFFKEFIPLSDFGEKGTNGKLLLGEELDPGGEDDVTKICSFTQDSVKEGKFTTSTAGRVRTQFNLFNFFQTICYVAFSHTCDVPVAIQSANLDINVYEDLT